MVSAPLVISPEVSRGRLRRRHVTIAIVVALALFIAIATFLSSRPAPVRYETAPVERRTIVRRVELTGHLEVLERAEVPAPVAGRLVRVLQEAGARVSEGDTLALLDARAAVIAARGAEAGLSAATSRVAEATAALQAASAAKERLDRLEARELASVGELDAAEAEEKRARAALATARAESEKARQNLRSARLSESLTSVTTPISGVVLRAPETTGGAVSPERGPLFVVGSELGSLRIAAEVAESEVGELRPGQAARFTLPAFPGRSFDARVQHVGIDAERTAQAVRYRVELVAGNPEHALLPGMTATVSVEVARAERVLATRDAALRFRPDGAPPAPARSRVFRARKHQLEAIPVTVGLSDGAFTEVRPQGAGSLEAGVELAVGLLASGEDSTAEGPGIHLGKR
ncbi:MAG TPA: efflux RND transporter periplasmic adaptor subunit [Polyangiaceae bacterium]